MNESIIFYSIHETPEEEQSVAAARREYGHESPPPLAIFWYRIQARRWGADALKHFERAAPCCTWLPYGKGTCR